MLFKKKEKINPLKYSFIDNSILLTMKTIRKNGFFEIYRQTNEEKSVQILCFNPKTSEFQAFDKFHRMDTYYKISEPIMINGMQEEPLAPPKKEDLWTPIKFHYTLAWLREHFANR